MRAPTIRRRTSRSSSQTKAEKKAAKVAKFESESIESLAALKAFLTPDEISKYTDTDLRRFLKARSYDVRKALEMVRNDIIWRRQYQIDTILSRPPPKLEFLKRIWGRSVGIHGCPFTDKEGRPCYIEKIGAMITRHNLKDYLSVEEWIGVHSWLMEDLMARCDELDQQQIVWILDMQGLGMSSRKNLKFISAMAPIDEQHYPERIARIVIINCPWIFPALFKLVSPFIPTETKTKISVSSGSPFDTLSEIIDTKNIPQEYGGTNLADIMFEPKLQAIRMIQSEPEDDIQACRILARESFVKEVVCGAEGALFQWWFTLATTDIKYSIEWIPATVLENPRDEVGRPFVVRPQTKYSVDSGYPSYGSFTVREAGRLVFTFDNTSSRFKAKDLRYAFQKWPRPRRSSVEFSEDDSD